MVKNSLLIFIFFVLGVLSVGWWTNCAAIVAKNEAALQKFVSVGPRFTGDQGQELCERVRLLEEFSIGFRQSGHKPLDCDYGARK